MSWLPTMSLCLLPRCRGKIRAATSDQHQGLDQAKGPGFGASTEGEGPGHKGSGRPRRRRRVRSVSLASSDQPRGASAERWPSIRACAIASCPRFRPCLARRFAVWKSRGRRVWVMASFLIGTMRPKVEDPGHSGGSDRWHNSPRRSPDRKVGQVEAGLAVGVPRNSPRRGVAWSPKNLVLVAPDRIPDLLQQFRPSKACDPGFV